MIVDTVIPLQDYPTARQTSPEARRFRAQSSRGPRERFHAARRYLFEKTCHVPEGLARFAEELRLLPAGLPALREAGAFLSVALRHGLRACSEVAGARFEVGWVTALCREGSAAWKKR